MTFTIGLTLLLIQKMPTENKVKNKVILIYVYKFFYNNNVLYFYAQPQKYRDE